MCVCCGCEEGDMGNRRRSIGLLLSWTLAGIPGACSDGTRDVAQAPQQPAAGATPALRQEGSPINSAVSPTEAPAGYDDQSNGFAAQPDMDVARETFDEIEGKDDGLGPVYNAQSCRECHQDPVSGAASQITELRAGHFNGLSFINHPGGSLINDRAIDAAIQERIQAGNEV